MRSFPRLVEGYPFVVRLFDSFRAFRPLARVAAAFMIVTLLSPIFPVVGVRAARNSAKPSTRPLSAPPEPFLMPGEKRSWEQLGDRFSSLASDVVDLFSINDPQTGQTANDNLDQDQMKAE